MNGVTATGRDGSTRRRKSARDVTNDNDAGTTRTSIIIVSCIGIVSRAARATAKVRTTIRPVCSSSSSATTAAGSAVSGSIHRTATSTARPSNARTRNRGCCTITTLTTITCTNISGSTRLGGTTATTATRAALTATCTLTRCAATTRGKIVGTTTTAAAAAATTVSRC
jgi:hypothetical protein